MDRKLLNLPQKRIFWIDLEMSGLQPDKDPIMEVAAIITDWNFKEIATYHGIVKNKVSVIKSRMANKENVSFWNKYSKSKEGLLKQNKNGKSIKKIEKELLDLIDRNFKPAVPVLLGGSSVHVDRRFIIEQMPKLNNRLHYRMLDVSAWKVVFEGKYHKNFTKPNKHRALDDIHGSILELQYYLTNLK